MSGSLETNTEKSSFLDGHPEYVHTIQEYGLELANDYGPELHHPVHLDDCLGPDGEYLVIHKLGVGQDSLIWLCLVRDSNPTQYVAVKVLIADDASRELKKEQEMISRLRTIAQSYPVIARYCSLPIDQFIINGPNGFHQCYVYAAAGPSLVNLKKEIDGDPGLTPPTSPEILFGEDPSAASDIWALACTIFEIRTGNFLLCDKSTEATDEYLMYTVRRLSQPLAEPWWSTSWKLRREFYEDAPDSQGNAVMVNGIPEFDNGRSLLQMTGWLGGLKLERADGQPLHRIMSMEENDLFVDLLNIMLKYDPKERPTAEQVLQHPWFKFRSEE
ncbi:kinase-like domain-containing protein [Aspergillus venezuelensis]